MSKTLLFGGSGFFGPVILEKDPEIVSVGRTKPPKNCKNKHIQMNSLDELNILDDVEFDKVKTSLPLFIFLLFYRIHPTDVIFLILFKDLEYPIKNIVTRLK